MPLNNLGDNCKSEYQCAFRSLARCFILFYFALRSVCIIFA